MHLVSMFVWCLNSEYSHLIEDDGFILLLDSFKAFDVVGDTFIFKTLYHFGFELKFINIIKMLYDDIILNSCWSSQIDMPKT